MCGASKCSSSSAAYSQTLSGLAEGLSNNNITPVGDPRRDVLTRQARHTGGGWLAAERGVAAVAIVSVQPGGNDLAAFDVAA